MNAGFRGRPCGTLLPNELGCFDMMGNVSEWCHNLHANYSKDMNESTVTIDTIAGESISLAYRDIRGGSWRMDPAVLRSATRIWMGPKGAQSNIGFRAARSCP
jgi:formylglycine-generating enzyme required for sulfatase activity